jgi:hypothetical protein
MRFSRVGEVLPFGVGSKGSMVSNMRRWCGFSGNFHAFVIDFVFHRGCGLPAYEFCNGSMLSKKGLRDGLNDDSC